VQRIAFEKSSSAIFSFPLTGRYSTLDCVAFLEAFGYQVIVSISPAQSYGLDGIVIARNPSVMMNPFGVRSEWELAPPRLLKKGICII
jgi:hypothetical protein